MEDVQLDILGLTGIGTNGFKISAGWNDTKNWTSEILQFQAVKRVNGSRVEERNFSARVPIWHILHLLEAYVHTKGGALNLVGQQPRLRAFIKKIDETFAAFEAEAKAKSPRERWKIYN